MRRSKSSGGSQIMHHQKNIENVRISKNSNTRSSSLELATHHEDQQQSSTSSFRLMEVSRGAQRLNYAIGSWSNEEKNIFESKHVAKDLLKGALDLQESLVMLGKLQEASHYMNTLNKKHERGYPISDGYSPRNSSEELKKVIRDSLARQKMSTNAEKGAAYSYSGSSPSASSSQSSLHYNTSEHSSVSSQKAKSSPSLIAKLMGMEEDYPLKLSHENEKVSSPQRPVFEIARPKVRRFQTAEKRTLNEVLDAMRFKGLLRSNYFEEAKLGIHHSSHFEMEKKFNGDSPPIVLMKPISMDSPEMEAKVPIVRGEEAFYNRRMLRKLRSHEEVSSKPMSSSKEGTLTSKKVQKKLDVSKDEGARKQRGESKMKEMVARKLKYSQLALHKPQKEATDMKIDKRQKAKAKTVSKNKSEELEKQTLAKARRPESGSNTSTKTRVSRQPSTVTSTSSKRSTVQNAEPISTERLRNQLRKEQPVKNPTTVESVTKIASESSLISSNSDGAANLNKEEEMKRYDESQSQATSLQETNPETADEVSEDINRKGLTRKTVECGDNNLGEFLLSNAAFLSHAAELFNLDSNVSTSIFQTPSISESAMCSTRLVLDCANELAGCKSSRLSQTVSPLSQLTLQGKPRVRISLEKLVEDVCNGIEGLRRHSKLAVDVSLIADSMHSILERDIMCDGRWDIGWRYGFSSDEADQVVSDIERLVFLGLIEEVFE